MTRSIIIGHRAGDRHRRRDQRAPRAREMAVTVNRILIGLAVAFAIIAIGCDAIGITWAALVPAVLAGIALGQLR